jgi:hypothetical protein
MNVRWKENEKSDSSMAGVWGEALHVTPLPRMEEVNVTGMY